MSNKKYIFLFIVGIIVLSVALIARIHLLNKHKQLITPQLIYMKADEIKAIKISNGVHLEKQNDKWIITSPIKAIASNENVMRLIDLLTLENANDVITDDEAMALGRKISDFGFDANSPQIKVYDDEHEACVIFGNATPNGQSNFARVTNRNAIYTVPCEVLNSVMATTDAYREHKLCTLNAEEIDSVEFHNVGNKYIRLERSGKTWRIVQPVVAMAHAEVVENIISAITSARATGFANSNNTTTEDAYSIIIRNNANDITEKITFGTKVADANLIYAIVRGGTETVTVAPELATLCRVTQDTFYDRRLYPIAMADIKRIDMKRGTESCTLQCSGEGAWQLVTPIHAAADFNVVTNTLHTLLSMDNHDENSSENIMSVTLSTPTTNFTANVNATVLREFNAFRSHQMLSVASNNIMRITLRNDKGRETTLMRNREGKWPNTQLIAALQNLQATKIETLTANREDFVRYGLDKPSYNIIIDLEGADAMRSHILVGLATPDGGHYVSMSGSETIFILSDHQIELLTNLNAKEEETNL